MHQSAFHRKKRAAEAARPNELTRYLFTVPVSGSRISGVLFGFPLKSNMFITEPATRSNEPGTGRRLDLVDGLEVPVLFDEAQAGGLIGQRVIDEILLRPRRNHEERQTRPVAAASGKRAAARTAADSRGRNGGGVRRRRRCGQRQGRYERVVRIGVGIVAPAEIVGRRIDDRAVDVIVPAIRIVVLDEHCRALPNARLLQSVEHLNDKGLLQQRIGVARVRVLIFRGLQINHGGQVVGLQRGQKSLRSYWWLAGPL